MELTYSFPLNYYSIHLKQIVTENGGIIVL